MHQLQYASIGVAKNCLRRNKSKDSGPRELYRGRRLHSEYFTLYYRNMIDSDRELHVKCVVRMSKERFDHLLSLVRDKIMKKDTQMH